MARHASRNRSTRVGENNAFTAKKNAIVLALFGLAATNVSAAQHDLTYVFNDKHNGYAEVYLPSGQQIQAGDSVTLTSTNQNVLISGGSGALHASQKNTAGTTHQLNINGGSFVSENDYNWAMYGATRITQDGMNVSSTNTGVTMENTTGDFDIHGAGRVSAQSTYNVSNSIVTVKNSTLNGRKMANGQIYGGGYVNAKGAKLIVENSQVIVENVNGAQVGSNIAPSVYGGGNLRGAETGSYAGEGTLMETKTTMVVVSGDNTNLEGVYGGGRISGNDETSLAELKATNTNVTIKGGTIHEVVGGHHINYYGQAKVQGKSTVVINGGTIENVIGGNLLAFDEAGSFTGENPRHATTKNAEIIVKGGTINNIYGGGFVTKPKGEGVEFTSLTENATINIEGGEITGNIYGGGYAQGEGTVVQVKHAEISISNVTVCGDIITTEGRIEADESGALGKSEATSTANMTLTNVTATNATVESKVGNVELRAEGQKTTSIAKLNVAEGVKVALTADGDANDVAKGDIKKAIQIQDGGYAGGTISMAEGMQQGAVQGYVGSDGQTHTTQQTNSIMSNTLDLYAGSTLALNRIMMSDLRNRMGDLRTVVADHGVWARYNGGKFSGKQNLDNEFTTFEIGVDTVAAVDAPRIGLAFSYTKADADMNRGSADMDAFSLALYGTKMYDSGLYVDMIGRMATAKSDVSIDGNKTGSVDNMVLSLSGELGWRIDLNKQFYVEPQAELTYTYINDDTLTLSEGTSYRFDAVNSFIGRAGVAAGLKWPNNMGDVYVRLGAAHEFAGDAAVHSATTIHELDGKDTWFEYGLGANFNVNQNTYIYTELERSAGASLEQDWRMNLGVRYSF